MPRKSLATTSLHRHRSHTDSPELMVVYANTRPEEHSTAHTTTTSTTNATDDDPSRRNSVFFSDSAASNPHRVTELQPKPEAVAEPDAPIAAARYTYDQLIGVHLHGTSPMQFDYRVRQPMIRCTVLDAATGRPLRKSDARRSAVLPTEPPALDYLQPVLSAACRFRTDTEFIECEWNELLVINEDVEHIRSTADHRAVIMFELVAAQTQQRCDFLRTPVADGWQYICWAFLRPHDYVGRRCRLQWFEYVRTERRCPWRRRRQRQPDVYAEWQLGAAGRRRYPATLDVTLKAVRAGDDKQQSPPQLRRPLNALQADRRGDLRPERAQRIVSAPAAASTVSVAVHHWHRAVGRPCRVPNRLVSRVAPAPPTRGSLAARFSPDGQLLAIACVPIVPRQPHDISVVRVADNTEVWRLSAHTRLVYALEWFDMERVAGQLLLLLSVSADRTAIVWRLDGGESGCSNWTVLPHPCFVYAGRFLDNRRSEQPDNRTLCVVTAGRDAVLRCWRVGVKRPRAAEGGDAELVQELLHPADPVDYIAAMAVATTSLFSADSAGRICEWRKQTNESSDNSSKYALAYHEDPRTVAQLNGIVRQVQLNRYEDMLYALVQRDDGPGRAGAGSVVVSVAVRTGQRVRSFELHAGSTPACFALSECGSLLLAASGDRVQGWPMLLDDGERGACESFAVPTLERQLRCSGGYVSGLDCCRRSHLCSLSVFGGAQNGGGGGADRAAVFVLGWTEDAEDTKKQSVIGGKANEASGKRPLADASHLRRRRAADRQQQQDLDRIIQRLDAIFARPQNRTDDVKSRQIDGQAHVVDVRSDDDDDVELVSLDAEKLSRSGTFVIRPRSRPSNLTFVVSRSSVSGMTAAGGRADRDGDETTVSESL